MPEVYVTFSRECANLIYLFSAFIKEMGVSVDYKLIHRNIQTLLISGITFDDATVQQDDLSKLSYRIVLHLSEDYQWI